MSDNVNSENIFADINNGYYHFTVAEKKVAEYVLNQRTDVQYMSISELADECGVAEATISRFCRRLKLTGYNSFKLAIAKAATEEQRGNAERGDYAVPYAYTNVSSDAELGRSLCSGYVAALDQTLSMVHRERVERAVDLLCGAHRVYCMGQGGSMLMAQVAAHQFSTVDPRFFAVQDAHVQVSTAALMSQEDVILFFSYSGSTKELVELMDIARERKVKVILITRFTKSPGAARADVVLQCGSNEGPLQLGSMPAKMAQLFVVDLLFHEFIRRDPERAQVSKERIAEALAQRHL